MKTIKRMFGVFLHLLVLTHMVMGYLVSWLQYCPFSLSLDDHIRFDCWTLLASVKVTRQILNIFTIYTTKGRDRFHWAATPLKPYKVGNICYMTYRCSVLYFLNLSLKHFFPLRKRQFLWKYPNPETVFVPCLNVSRMPNRRTRRHCTL